MLGPLPLTLLLHMDLIWTGVLTVAINLIMASAFASILICAIELMPDRIGLIGGLFYGLNFGLGGIAAAILRGLADSYGVEAVYPLCAFLPLAGLLAWFLPKKSGMSRLTSHFRQSNHAVGRSLQLKATIPFRGLQTLPLRMEAHCERARTVADALNTHRRVAEVLFPGLPDDPGHALATRQMGDYGAMLSFIIKGGAEAAMAVAGRPRLVVRATSLGGTHSLIAHRSRGRNPRRRRGCCAFRSGWNNPQDIIDDLTQALNALA